MLVPSAPWRCPYFLLLSANRCGDPCWLQWYHCSGNHQRGAMQPGGLNHHFRSKKRLHVVKAFLYAPVLDEALAGLLGRSQAQEGLGRVSMLGALSIFGQVLGHADFHGKKQVPIPFPGFKIKRQFPVVFQLRNQPGEHGGKTFPAGEIHETPEFDKKGGQICEFQNGTLPNRWQSTYWPWYLPWQSSY